MNRAHVLFRRVAAAGVVAALATGCATAPKNAQLEAKEWRALAPLELNLRVHRPKTLLAFEPMGESVTGAGLASSGDGALLMLLTLPVWLAVDLGRSVAEDRREALAADGNATLGNLWLDLVQDDVFREAFRRGVSEALPDVTIAEGVSRPPAGELLNPRVLGADLYFMLRPDGRALLARVALRLPDVPPSFTCKKVFQCAQMQRRLGEARFTTLLNFHSEPLPELPRARRRDPADYAALWLENGGELLRQAFAQAAESVARLTRMAVANEATAGRDSMDPARALFRVAGHWLDVPADGREDAYTEVLLDMPGALRTVYGEPPEATR